MNREQLLAEYAALQKRINNLEETEQRAIKQSKLAATVTWYILAYGLMLTLMSWFVPCDYGRYGFYFYNFGIRLIMTAFLVIAGYAIYRQRKIRATFISLHLTQAKIQLASLMTANDIEKTTLESEEQLEEENTTEAFNDRIKRHSRAITIFLIVTALTLALHIIVEKSSHRYYSNEYEYLMR